MEILCTRPGCPRPLNNFPELDDRSVLTKSPQKYCTACGMPLILGGHYIPFKLLGKGGFGTAFLACDRYTPSLRRCVIKQFQPTGDLSEKALRKALDLFEREAMVLDTLGRRHEQIPELYAFFPLSVDSRTGQGEEQYFYLVQEFIEGKNLEEELAEKGVFNEAEVRKVLTEMLKVLQFVHENESIHRDIKPSNIMRHRNGRLYLLDFGAVKQVTTEVGNPEQAKRSTGIYSMGFAPPEQIKGATVYPSTDLYALAVTCLNLLSGKDAHELYDSFHDCWNWRPHVNQISDRLATTLDKMLLASPKERFQSAAEVLEALQAPKTKIQTTPPPPPPPVSPTNPGKVAASSRSRFSLLEILGSAAFIGFQGTLVVTAFHSLLAMGGLVLGLMSIGSLIFAVYRRLIEGKDLPILAFISALIMLLPVLRGGLDFIQVILIGIFIAAAAVAVTALFRLVYQILARFL